VVKAIACYTLKYTGGRVIFFGFLGESGIVVVVVVVVAVAARAARSVGVRRGRRSRARAQNVYVPTLFFRAVDRSNRSGIFLSGL